MKLLFLGGFDSFVFGLDSWLNLCFDWCFGSCLFVVSLAWLVCLVGGVGLSVVFGPCLTRLGFAVFVLRELFGYCCLHYCLVYA